MENALACFYRQISEWGLEKATPKSFRFGDLEVEHLGGFGWGPNCFNFRVGYDNESLQQLVKFVEWRTPAQDCEMNFDKTLRLSCKVIFREYDCPPDLPPGFTCVVTDEPTLIRIPQGDRL